MAAKQNQKECLDNVYLIICQITFILSWFALKASCVYASLVFKPESPLENVNSQENQNQVELIQILN